MPEIKINQNRVPLDEAYMQMAEIWAKRSKANRNQVGAILVKNSQVISDGYNGMPAGSEDDTCEFLEDVDAYSYRVQWGTSPPPPKMITKPETLHAESNCISKLAKNGGIGSDGATMYVTLSPCFDCAKLIKQAGISRVVYRNDYRNIDGILLLKKLGIIVDKI